MSSHYNYIFCYLALVAYSHADSFGITYLGLRYLSGWLMMGNGICIVELNPSFVVEKFNKQPGYSAHCQQFSLKLYAAKKTFCNLERGKTARDNIKGKVGMPLLYYYTASICFRQYLNSQTPKYSYSSRFFSLITCMYHLFFIFSILVKNTYYFWQDWAWFWWFSSQKKPLSCIQITVWHQMIYLLCFYFVILLASM